MTTRFLLRGTGHIVNKDKDIAYTHKCALKREPMQRKTTETLQPPAARMTDAGPVSRHETSEEVCGRAAAGRQQLPCVAVFWVSALHFWTGLVLCCAMTTCQ